MIVSVTGSRRAKQLEMRVALHDVAVPKDIILTTPDEVARRHDIVRAIIVRARVKADLEARRSLYLPAMGEIVETPSSDYRFRAVAAKAELAAALGQIVLDLDYSNFKNAVAKAQGGPRAQLYHKVWADLYRLQEAAQEPAAKKPPR